jgi:hypothetical protein
MRITEQFLNVLICCREKLQHVWDSYKILVWMRVGGDFTKQCSVVMARCVCVCVSVYEELGSLCLLVTELRESIPYHMSVCNDILDNAFYVHGNKMVKLNSTVVPAVSKNTCGRLQCEGKDNRHLYSANTSVHFVTLFCFWLFDLTRWWQMTKLSYIVCYEKYRRKNVRERFQVSSHSI